MALRKIDYDSILKIDYHGPIVDQLENASAFCARMERYEEPTGGKQFYIPMRTGRTTSIGARNDGNSENLPTSGSPGYNNAVFTAKSLYATVRVTGLAMRSSKKDSYAFARAQVRDMEDTTKDLKKDVNRILFGDGSAELARLSATATSTAGGVATFTLNSDLYPVKPTRFMYAGERIDPIVRSNGNLANSITGMVISSVDSATQITVTGAGTSQTYTATSATDTVIFAREGNIGDNTASPAVKEIKEPFGLFAALHSSSPGDIWATNAQITADFGSIDRTAANSFWKGNVLANSGTLRPFSVNLVQQGIDEAATVGGGEISLISTNFPIWRVYGSLLASAKQADILAMKLDGGWEALSVNGIPMVKDVDSPDYTIFCIDESTMMLGVIDQWNWIDEGGGILSRLPGQDQYEAVMVRDIQLICDKPIANTIIRDVAHS